MNCSKCGKSSDSLHGGGGALVCDECNAPNYSSNFSTPFVFRIVCASCGKDRDGAGYQRNNNEIGILIEAVCPKCGGKS